MKIRVKNDFLFVVNLDGVVTKLPLCNGGKTQLKIEDTKVHDFSSLGTADLSRAAQGIKRGQLGDAKQMN